ncbi:MAG TPA: hypothetical protein PLW02_02330 [Verrucomicrobiota bacterium]|nr:hypothetical protein [Verrucomicrobiota bacterium]
MAGASLLPSIDLSARMPTPLLRIVSRDANSSPDIHICEKGKRRRTQITQIKQIYTDYKKKEINNDSQNKNFYLSSLSLVSYPSVKYPVHPVYPC